MQPYNFEPACWATDKDGLDNINEMPTWIAFLRWAERP